MTIFTSLETTELKRPQVISVGNFDGGHLGHAYMLKIARDTAVNLQSEVTAVTFWPAPMMVLRPDAHLRFLTPGLEKAAALEQTRLVDHIVMIPFSHEIAQLNAEEFLQMLLEYIPISALVEGDDFRLGHNRSGDSHIVSGFAGAHNFTTTYIPRLQDANGPISSTRIRESIQFGDMVSAENMLGRPYAAKGVVIHGDARGRQLGFPTANLRVSEHKLLPVNGIYAVQVIREKFPNTLLRGAASIGTNPTFNGQEHRLEVYILDFNSTIYDEQLEIQFIQRLRGEEKFSGADELIEQMSRDVEEVRRVLDIREVRA